MKPIDPDDSRIIRVFPRETSGTPRDDGVRVNCLPELWDNADTVLVSVTFDSDRSLGETLAKEWECVAKDVRIGGPAYDDPGGEFVPGLFLRDGYTITSRGCPGKCPGCKVPEREGAIRLLPIRDGYMLQDNNILACPEDHQRNVFAMLGRQSRRPQFTGGLESRLLKPWHVDEFCVLNPLSLWFAYDKKGDYAPLRKAVAMLREAGLMETRRVYCYVLIGMPGDTLEAAQNRCQQVARLGVFPQSMLLNGGDDITTATLKEWRSLHREWASKIIVGSKMGEYATGTCTPAKQA